MELSIYMKTFIYLGKYYKIKNIANCDWQKSIYYHDWKPKALLGQRHIICVIKSSL